MWTSHILDENIFLLKKQENQYQGTNVKSSFYRKANFMVIVHPLLQ